MDKGCIWARLSSMIDEKHYLTVVEITVIKPMRKKGKGGKQAEDG